MTMSLEDTRALADSIRGEIAKAIVGQADTIEHLLIALIVPDKRVGRNLAAAIAVALHTLLPGIVRLGSVTYVATVVLCAVMACELQQIGWSAISDDARHPARTLRLLFLGRGREIHGETV